MLILVLGSNGMLGREITKALSHQGIPHLAYTKDLLDITDELSIHRIMKANRISIVINCAAYTNVAKAEDEISTARRINADGPQILSEVCNKHNVKLIHFSTDYVFDGCQEGKLKEDDIASPLNMYGKSKLEGENAIILSCKNYKIFRLQWLYGRHGNNFIYKVINKYRENGVLKIVDDQFGSPCSTFFVTNVILAMIDRWDRGENGIYHLTHDNYCSWYEFTRYLFNFFNMKNIVAPISVKSFKDNVVRPDNCMMDNYKIRNTFKLETLGSWESDITHFVTSNSDIFGSFIDLKKGE